VLNIGCLGVDGANYYLDTVASGVEEYYTGAGEAPGVWAGSESASLGLDGEVCAESLRAVLGGVDPVSGDLLGSGQGRRVPGFDLTFRAPKSVSVLWGLADPLVADEARRGHDAAVTAAVGYLEGHAAGSRRGHGGTERVTVGGFVGAAFRHRSSRAGDPLLHTHVLVANSVRAVDDGKWRTLDGRRLYAHAKTAGYVYQAQLRHELTQRLGVAWQPVVNGWADIAGVPDDVIRAFSQRRAQIVAHMAARGESSAAAAQVATLETRKAKDRDVSFESLHDGWRTRAADLGFDDPHVHALTDRKRQPVPSPHQIAADLLGPAGLTAHASSFDRRDVVRAWCDRLPAGAPEATVQALTDALLADDNPHIVALDTGVEPRWSTVELVAIERRAVATAVARQTTGAGVAHDAAVAGAVARRPSLAGEQAAMVDRLTTSGAGVEVVIGKAGAGKTFALDAARDAWTASGHRVIGCALAARAAAELHAGAGIDSTTIDGLLADLDRGWGLDRRNVVVVDEAGMVGTRKLARLLEHAARTDAKVVLVGDPHQLPAIHASGLFDGLARRLPATRLAENRRQREPWERDALDELRAGRPAEAIRDYVAHGRVSTADTADAVREQLVGDWWSARAEHGRDAAVMVAARTADVDDLNDRARQRMTADGLLHGPCVDTADRAFQVGDEILCLRNNQRLGVVNGTRAVVDAVDTDTRALRVTVADGARVVLPAAYLDDGYVTHGYAITGHKAQGMTCDEAFVLGSDAVYREWGYTAMSRGRHSNRLYVVAAEAKRDDAHTHHSRQVDDPIRRITRALERSHAKHMATDEAPLLADPAPAATAASHTGTGGRRDPCGATLPAVEERQARIEAARADRTARILAVTQRPLEVDARGLDLM
jgi:conjugative relaxase-like TrwC/TraI family protein